MQMDSNDMVLFFTSVSLEGTLPVLHFKDNWESQLHPEERKNKLNR